MSALNSMRYAAYIRTSSEDQMGGFSIEAQRHAIEAWVEMQGGIVFAVYIDEAFSGRTTDRPQFQAMRQDAKKGLFDALVVHKFDRFARNRSDALAVKSLLRHDYGIKVFSVTEPSEDSDGVEGALMEGLMESVAEWYSRNLAEEAVKSKRERSSQGLHNNQAPFGYDKNAQKILVHNPHEATGLLMAFEAYAIGDYSDADIAQLLNSHGYVLKTGRPFSKDTVRLILQNKTYLGKIRYQRYQENANGSRSNSAPIEWFEGQHEALISQELFDQCQLVRLKRAHHHLATPKYNIFLLRNLVYCYRCCNSAPPEIPFPAFGKMRAHGGQGSLRYYHCRAKDFDRVCEQKRVRCEVFDQQVINILLRLQLPIEWQERIVHEISEILIEKEVENRLKDIRETIERMDFRWDQGFITDKADYLKKRTKLQQALDELAPAANDGAGRAVDIVQNFANCWVACQSDPQSQSDLIQLLVEKVYVQDEMVVALTFRGGYSLTL